MLLYINNLHIESLLFYLLICGTNCIIRPDSRNRDNPYMVYMVKTEDSLSPHAYWYCGGSIVHPQYVLTSAACLLDVDRMYVIAGYRIYVDWKTILIDECTKRYRKRVIRVCVPKFFELINENRAKWTTLDIGFAKVESPFDFKDVGYTVHCSYKPKIADINFLPENEVENTYAIIYGWGNERGWGEQIGYRTQFHGGKPLLSTNVTISPKVACVNAYKEIGHIVERLMICTNQEQGFCQNDHGGPLIHKRKGLILGVQSAFMLNSEQMCRGPFLYTSTHLMKAFIFCVLYETVVSKEYCNEEAEKIRDIATGSTLLPIPGASTINWETPTSTPYEETTTTRYTTTTYYEPTTSRPIETTTYRPTYVCYDNCSQYYYYNEDGM